MGNQVALPRLKRDWIGRYVRLRQDHETNGGAIFEAGTVMHVEGYYRGLSLDAVRACPQCRLKYRHYITRVACADVELLPADFVPPVESDPQAGAGH